jgi:hypothetical protein
MTRVQAPFSTPAPGLPGTPRALALCLLTLSFPAFAEASSPVGHLTETLERFGGWGPLAFIAAFVLASVLCLPVVFLNLAAGALFGVSHGLLYAWIGAQIGATAAFFISRTLAHDRVARFLARRPLLQAVSEAVSTGTAMRLISSDATSPAISEIGQALENRIESAESPLAPTTTAIAVSSIGRNRTAPASTTASASGMPSRSVAR